MKDIDLKSLKPLAKKLFKKLRRHAVFGALMVVLLAYLFVVWRINSLASTEPAVEDQATALTQAHLPKVDKKAIAQIQALEKSNTQIQSLFNQARNNPFQE
jgi:uncharacterized iron-regulated membrane protein